MRRLRRSVIGGRSLSAPERTVPGLRSTPGADPAPRRLEGYLSLLPANRDNPRMHLYPGLSSKPWYVASEFSVARALEENFERFATKSSASTGGRFTVKRILSGGTDNGTFSSFTNSA